jgi:hypothetical protein
VFLALTGHASATSTGHASASGTGDTDEEKEESEAA